MLSSNGENAFIPFFLSFHHSFCNCNPIRLGWYGGGVSYEMYLMYFSLEYKLTLQNSGSLSVTIVLGVPFLENTVLNSCFLVVTFLFVTLITSGHPENESTSIKNKPISLTCAEPMWILIYGLFSLCHE